MPPEIAPTMPSRVLVADDDYLVATGLGTALASLGCGVIGPVANGKQAIDAAGRDRPDVALLDIRMPECDGIDAAATLWEAHQIPSVIVTAYSDETYVRRSQETGVFGYLFKPVTADALRAALAVALSRAQAAQALHDRVAQLETTLSNRKIIEQAKWHLVETRHMTEPDAHGFLQRTSRNSRRSLVDVAREVLATAPGGPQPDPVTPLAKAR